MSKKFSCACGQACADMGIHALYAGFRYLGKEIYWREMQFRDMAIFDRCYVPVKVALHIEDGEASLSGSSSSLAAS
jgi:hypothetical protein